MSAQSGVAVVVANQVSRIVSFAAKAAITAIAVVVVSQFIQWPASPTHDTANHHSDNIDKQASAPPTKASPVSASTTPALSGLLAKGATVNRHFAVSKQLTGWDISFRGNRDIYYTTGDGQYLLLGAVLNAQGKNISAQQQAAIGGQRGGTRAPQKTPVSQATLKRLYSQLADSDTIDIDQGGPDLYVIYEPHCPFCARLHRALGDVKANVHYAPVAFLSPRSAKAAAILLDSETPKATMDSLTRVSMTEAPMGDWITAHTPDHDLPDVSQTLKKNAQLMHVAGISGTPAIFYKDAEGKVHLHKGLARTPALQRMIQAARDHKAG